MKIQTAFLVMICYSILVGCSANNKSVETDNTQVIAKNAAIEKQLISAAQSIEKSLGTLALNQQTNTPPLLNTAPLVTAEGGMGGTTFIDWTGPIEPLIQKIANLTDYRLKILGKEPAIPIVISITQKKAIIADILKNASLQAGKRANIMVFPANRIIEIRYRSS